MKGMNSVIAITLAVICVLGWVISISDFVSQKGMFETYVSQADDWFADGLYHRAIEGYRSALAEQSSEDVYIKILVAYQARMAEAPEETEEDYQDFLEDAVTACPENELLVKTLATYYLDHEKYTKAYACLCDAIENGIDSVEILRLLQQAQYAYSLRNTTYTAIKPFAGASYTLAREGEWGTYDLEGGYILPCNYEDVGLCNEDGFVVVTSETDSRLVDGDGFVYGIFAEKVSDAGLFSEGYVAAKENGKFYYYDEFAKQLFGGYDQAGAYQDGYAAVKTNNMWEIIDETGKIVSDSFAHIVLNTRGEYAVGDFVLAAKDAGKYALYNDALELKVNLECSDVDILTEDGLIAVCQSGKWGFVNLDGGIEISPQYEQAKSFSNGLAAVCKNGLWGFINKEGVLVIDYQFSDVGYFDANGVCSVRTDFNQEYQENVEMIEKPSWKLLVLKNGITED